VNGFSNTATGFRSLLADTSGSYNVANGAYALNSNTTGDLNVAIGDQAMQLNTTGTRNTGSGSDALHDNTTGSFNTACGADALANSTTADENTAVGRFALGLDTTGAGNTAVGDEALVLNSTGSRNIALGMLAGSQLTTGNDNIDIGHIGNGAEASTIRIGTFGTQTRTFIAGIRPVTTGIANAIPVLIDGAGQLGTTSSSRRFKKDISDMGDRTARLLELRPVVFHYKQEQTLPDGSEPPLEYGLIAEEVAEIFPELVVYDDEGQPMTVKYHLLSSMLLNELDKLHARVEEQAEHQRSLEERLDALEARAAAAPGSR